MFRILPARIRPVAASAVLLFMALLLPGSALAQACPPFPYSTQTGDLDPSYLSWHDRIGFNVAYDIRCTTSDIPESGVPVCESVKVVDATTGLPLSDYNVAQLRAGWYFDYRLDSGPQQGLGYLRMIRLSELQADWRDRLRPTIASNLGRSWVIGNEPDRFGQDPKTPAQYAALYRDIYSFIKSVDPTAKVGIAPVVQPTGHRMEYLNAVLAAYGGPLPTDFFTLHSFILSELGAGAGLAVGITPIPTPLPNSPVEYTLKDHGNIEIFRDRIIEFRKWMADNGYRNKPLIISEFGILFGPDTFYTPDEGCTDPNPGQANCYYDLQRVTRYMTDAFDFLLTQKSGTTGYPPDDNRLVQAWSWYSLNDVLRHSLYQADGYNGSLIDRVDGDYTVMWPPPKATPDSTPTPTPMTLLGPSFRDYIRNIPDPTTTPGPGNALNIDLYTDYTALTLLPQPTPVVTINRAEVVAPPGDPGNIKLGLTIRNTGNISAVRIAAYLHDFQISSRFCTADVNIAPRCASDQLVTITCSLPPWLEPGNHTVLVFASGVTELGDTKDNRASVPLNALAPTLTPTPTPTATPTLRPGETRTPATNTPIPPTVTNTPKPTATRTPAPVTPNPFDHTYLPALRR